MTIPIRYITIQRFAEETGYTENAIRTKIRDGVWREGQEWVKAPDGRNLIDIEGYNTWVAGGSAAVFHPTQGNPARSMARSGLNNEKKRQGASPVPLGLRKMRADERGKQR